MGRRLYRKKRPSVHDGAVQPIMSVARSDLMSKDRTLALLVNHGLHKHYVRGTGSTYRTAARDFAAFCRRRGLAKYPVDQVSFCGYLHTAAKRIMMSSLGVYMAGIKDAAILAGYGWSLTGNEMVRRTMRYLKHKHPAKAKGRKLPITVQVLYKILPLLPGWPNMSAMSAEDRVFASASVTGVAGFLRGGEFLHSPHNTRPVLKASAVSITRIAGNKAQVVHIPQPKARWWVETEAVPCFANTSDDTFCPVRLWREYSSRCTGLKQSGPAFLLLGKPLTRDYMVTRTSSLMRAAGLSMTDHKGLPMDVQSASWRSGAVCSAIDEDVSVPHIMVMGRWSSSAWENYMLQAPLDLRRPAQKMWSATVKDRTTYSFDVDAFLKPSLRAEASSAIAGMNIMA
jgi:hypothetical protein